MKKILISILCLTLLMAGVPNVVYANEISKETINCKYSSEDIIDLASSIWPECEEALRNPKAKQQSNLRTVEEDSVIIQKTYKLSESELVMYVEKESGLAVAMVVENWVQTSQISGSGYVEYAGNLYATCGSAASNLINFRYRIYSSDYDRITNYGRFDNTKVSVTEHGKQDIETSSAPAYYTYQVYFQDDLGFLYGSTIINFRIQNNQFYCSAS